MRVLILSALALAACGAAQAAWPFGSEGKKPKTRVSTLLDPVNKLVDDATVQCNNQEFREAQKTYRKALEKLEKIALENFALLEKPEFSSTIETKRVFINTMIAQTERAATEKESESVKVTDTEELEKKLEFERLKPRDKVVRLMSEGRIQDAQLICERLCAPPNTNDVVALNLYAATLAAEGNFMQARVRLDQAIRALREDPVSYYNMARLLLQMSPSNRAPARGFYEDGRSLGGPKDAKLEKMLK